MTDASADRVVKVYLLQNIADIIGLAARRGAFRASELSLVGAVFDAVSAGIGPTGPSGPSGPAADQDTPEPEPEPEPNSDAATSGRGGMG